MCLLKHLKLFLFPVKAPENRDAGIAARLLPAPEDFQRCLGHCLLLAFPGVDRNRGNPAAAGFHTFRNVRIEPQFPTGLNWVRVCQETPYGTICVSWKRNGEDRADLHVEIPAGITARIDGKTFNAGSYDLGVSTRK